VALPLQVTTSLAEWLSVQASIWHEITTWYGWSSTRFSKRPSGFSPEDLYSNLVGVKITGAIVREIRFQCFESEIGMTGWKFSVYLKPSL